MAKKNSTPKAGKAVKAVEAGKAVEAFTPTIDRCVVDTKVAKAVTASLVKFQEFSGKMNDVVQRKIIKTLTDNKLVYMNIIPNGVLVRDGKVDPANKVISFKIRIQLETDGNGSEDIISIVSAYDFFRWTKAGQLDASTALEADGAIFGLFQITSWTCNDDFHPRFYSEYSIEDYRRKVGAAPVNGTTENWNAWNAKVDKYRATLVKKQNANSATYQLLHKLNAGDLLGGNKTAEALKVVALPTRVTFDATPYKV